MKKKSDKPLFLPSAALLRHYARTSREKWTMTLLYLLAEAVEKQGRVWTSSDQQGLTELGERDREMATGVSIGN